MGSIERIEQRLKCIREFKSFLFLDIFSGCMQAFIFAMLTMMNIATAVPEEE